LDSSNLFADSHACGTDSRACLTRIHKSIKR
jgi:hypothetical protein